MRPDRLEATRRNVLRTTAATGAATLGGVTTATAGRDPGAKEAEVLVGVSAGHDLRGTVAPAVPDGAELAHANDTLRYVAVRFPDDATGAARDAFADAVTDRDGVKYAEPNTTHRTLYTPNDPKYSQQCIPKAVDADDAWDTTLGSHDVTVAVVDTGIQYDHPDLDGNFCGDPGYDFVDDDDDSYPETCDESHGTAVAGIIAAEIDNGIDIAGLSQSCLLSARALDENGAGSTSDIADAIQWAADQGADVINLSLGGGGYSDTLKNAVSYAYDQGSLLVAAAGGDGSDGVAYPAAYSECVAVSTVDCADNFASFSSYGEEIELTAPGVEVTTLARSCSSVGYEVLSGTSFSTAAVSGVAGLTLGQWNLTNVELRNHLKGTAVDIGLSSDKQGCGRVDAANAVQTDPANRASDCTAGGGGGGTCGDRSTSGSVDDSLSSYSDSDCWTWNWEYDDPCRVCIKLDGPADADFDLYVNEGRAQCPTTSDYDYRSISTDSRESICIDDPDPSTALYVLVDSYSGSGSYTLTITEKAT
jgi:serine protease